MTHPARPAIHAIARIAFLLVLACTAIATVLRIGGLCFGCLTRKPTRPP